MKFYLRTGKGAMTADEAAHHIVLGFKVIELPRGVPPDDRDAPAFIVDENADAPEIDLYSLMDLVNLMVDGTPCLLMRPDEIVIYPDG